MKGSFLTKKLLLKKYLCLVKLKTGYKLLLARVLSLGVLVAYLYISIPVPHDHHHQNEEKVPHDNVTHLVDDCHNFIYHGAVTKTCKQHNHISEVKLACLHCHSLPFSKFVQLEFESSISIRPTVGVAINKAIEQYLVTWAPTISLRGPPILV